MSGFLKGVLVCLTVGIVLTSYIGQKESEAQARQDAITAISGFEEDVKAGLIIEDGVLVNETETEFKKDGGNAFGDAAGAIGNAVSSTFSGIIKFFAKIINGILS